VAGGQEHEVRYEAKNEDVGNIRTKVEDELERWEDQFG
jgi:hypothetical protein